MRHAVRGRKFHRKLGARKAFLKGLAHNLVMKERITTTEARAKEVRPFVERCITIARRQTVASLRLLLTRLPKPSAEKLHFAFAKRYQGRQGGFLRIIKKATGRKRDGAVLAEISFV